MSTLLCHTSYENRTDQPVVTTIHNNDQIFFWVCWMNRFHCNQGHSLPAAICCQFQHENGWSWGRDGTAVIAFHNNHFHFLALCHCIAFNVVQGQGHSVSAAICQIFSFTACSMEQMAQIDLKLHIHELILSPEIDMQLSEGILNHWKVRAMQVPLSLLSEQLWLHEAVRLSAKQTEDRYKCTSPPSAYY